VRKTGMPFQRVFGMQHLNPTISFYTLMQFDYVKFLLNHNLGGFMKAIFIPIYMSFFILAGCSSLTIKPGDFAWPVESVLTVDGQGKIQSERYSFSLNVKALLFAETQDSVNIPKVNLRMIRDVKGFYFITASQFKNVYVFEQTEGGLKLKNKIPVAMNGLSEPAFNQRAPYIQVVNGQNPTILLTEDGVFEGEKK
jgi:hypothetical protein